MEIHAADGINKSHYSGGLAFYVSRHSSLACLLRSGYHSLPFAWPGTDAVEKTRNTNLQFRRLKIREINEINVASHGARPESKDVICSGRILIDE
jgi:hypothetical protein